MDEILLFTDGSVNVKTKVGYGAYLFIPSVNVPLEWAKKRVIIKRSENTSSTKLELETLLWALGEIPSGIEKITVFTDSQNTAGLINRRQKLEAAGFCSKNGKQLNNSELYRELFKMTDIYQIQFKKVTGHQPSRKKDMLHQVFSIVDKASRRALRRAGKTI